MQQPMKCTELQEAPRNQAWCVLSNQNCSSSIREYQVEPDTPQKPHILEYRLVILVFCDFNFFLFSIVVSTIGLHCAFLILPNIPLNKLTTVISNVALEVLGFPGGSAVRNPPANVED